VDRLLPMFLARLIRRGLFTVTTAAGKTLGDGRDPPVAVRFTATKAQRAVILDPEFGLGEAYMDSTFVVARGTIAEVLEILFGQELIAAPIGPWRAFCTICSGACSNSIHDFAPAILSRTSYASPLRLADE
jgi:cyclopropane-fatty-acyl-phospholipid synthase